MNTRDRAHIVEMGRQGHIWLTAWYEAWLVIETLKGPYHHGQFHRYDRMRYEDEWRRTLGIPSMFE